MDNTMAAVMSLAMIAFGFTNGMVVGSLLQLNHVTILKDKLDDAVHTRFEMELEIDDLKYKIQQLEYKNAKIQKILSSDYSLPPPSLEFKRQDNYDADSEPESSPCTMTPDLTF